MPDARRKTVTLRTHRIDPAIDTHLLDKGLELMHVDDNAFNTHLTAVRHDPDKVVAAAKAHIDVYRDDPLHAWSVLHMLDRAGLKQARDLFNREARRRITGERTGCESDADLEELVAIQASEALAHLGAHDDLIEVVAKQDRRAIRLAAARAAYAANPALLKRLESALGADAAALHWKKADLKQLHVDPTAAPAKPAPAPAPAHAPAPAKPAKRAKPDAPALKVQATDAHATVRTPPKDRPLVGAAPIPDIVRKIKEG